MVSVADEHDDDFRVQTLLDELHVAIRVQEVRSTGMEGEEILDVHAIDGARTMSQRRASRDYAVVIGTLDPLIAIGIIRPGVSRDVPVILYTHRFNVHVRCRILATYI